MSPALLRSQAPSQLPAQAGRNAKDAPLRAVAVLEWTGDDETKPKKSRLVPVSIYDGNTLEDAGLYLARPEPIALAGEVEYQLKKDGKTVGLFDIQNAGHEQGSWVGYGEWKPAPAAKPLFAAKSDEDNEDDDKPTLHRKHHDDDSSASPSSSNGGSSTSSSKTSDDSDRPKLHKKDDSGSTANSGSTGTGSDSASDDSDHPTLHRKTPDDTTSSTGASSTGASTSNSAPPADPDRPVMKKSKAPQTVEEDIGHSTALPGVTDPDRPRLTRGHDNSQSIKVLPSLMGLPPEMRQTIGVSDARDKPDHPWTYTWANPGDEAKMKAALEDQARLALGITPPPKPAPARHTTTARKPVHSAKAAPAPASEPEPIPLEGEQFRVFELAYGSGATLVLSAHTSADPDPKQQKFVTLIAQPDLYGHLAILHKNVTDASHLDETPRMILVDAVDALADNRGELLFELRGATQRQFALYRVLRGSAEQIFETASNEFGAAAAQ